MSYDTSSINSQSEMYSTSHVNNLYRTTIYLWNHSSILFSFLEIFFPIVLHEYCCSTRSSSSSSSSFFNMESTHGHGHGFRENTNIFITASLSYCYCTSSTSSEDSILQDRETTNQPNKQTDSGVVCLSKEEGRKMCSSCD